MSDKQPGNPLHGVTLERILEELVADYGWAELGRLIDIRCFNNDPSIKSSLKFLRKTEWARKQVEELYLFKKKAKFAEYYVYRTGHFELFHHSTRLSIAKTEMPGHKAAYLVPGYASVTITWLKDTRTFDFLSFAMKPTR